MSHRYRFAVTPQDLRHTWAMERQAIVHAWELAITSGAAALRPVAWAMLGRVRGHGRVGPWPTMWLVPLLGVSA